MYLKKRCSVSFASFAASTLGSEVLIDNPEILIRHKHFPCRPHLVLSYRTVAIIIIMKP
jgi:hypothetical protein